MELCLFRIDQQEYAVPMTSVREVLNRPRISPIPLAPETLSGMTHFRGEVVPVFAVDHLLDSTLAPLSRGQERSRVLVVTQASQVLGIQVDQVDEKRFEDKNTAIFSSSHAALLENPVTFQNRVFRPVSLPQLFHSLQQTLSSITLQLLN
jgi:chemotaxis signal transduction protein